MQIEILGSELTHQSNLSLHMNNYQLQLKDEHMSMSLVASEEMLDCFSAKYIDLSFKHGFTNKYISLHKALKIREETNNVILFEGNSGVGKSTLAINICKCWAKGDLLQEYTAVILLSLRDPKVYKAESIKDLLEILDDDIKEDVYKEIVKCKGKKICFILDGFDELPYKYRRYDSLFSRNLKMKLTECTLIYTSRPGVRPEIVKNQWSDRGVIFIDGFQTQSIDRYISSAFEKTENGKELSDTLKLQLCSNPMVESILHVPINLSIVCLIFFHFSKLPETLTELYTLLCLRLILRHIITRTPNVEEIESLFSLNDLPKDSFEQFFQLCLLAYQGMKSKSITFRNNDLPPNGCLGLLRVTSFISVHGREKSFSFLHFTLQEFCAAWHISKLPTEEQLNLLEKYYNDDHFKMVWRFYSGITQLKDKKLLNFMLPYKQVKSRNTKAKIIKLLYHLYEAHNEEACQIVGDHYDGTFVNFYPDYLHFATYSYGNHQILLQAFRYFLIHYKGMLKFINVTTWPITDREVTVIINSLKERLKLQKDAISTTENLVLKVSLGFNSALSDSLLTSQSYSCFAKLLAQQYPIAEFYIDNGKHFHWNKNACDLTMSIFKVMLMQSKTLRVLDIYGIKMDPEDAIFLPQCRNTVLQDLRLRNCKLDPVVADKIGEMLAYNTSIISIDLSYNSICDEGVERIVYRLQNGNVLQYISLCGNKITAVGIEYLSKLLKTNTTITSLDLSHNRLEYKCVCHFLNSLSIAMKYIGLYGYPFAVEAIAATNAVDKVKSFGAVCNDLHKSFTSILSFSNILSSMPQLEVNITRQGWNEHSLLINAISNKNTQIRKLKIHYDYFVLNEKMAKELSVGLKNNEMLEELTISMEKQTAGDMSLMRLLISETSIKKIEFDFPVLFSIYRELLYKAPNTLEELSLGLACLKQYELGEINFHVQRINKLRSENGVNLLQVNIPYERHEGFDMYL